MSSNREHLAWFEQHYARYAERLPSAIEEIHGLWNRLCDSWNRKTFKELSTRIHRLAGSAGNYGFEKVGHLSRRIDQILHKIEKAGYTLTDTDRKLIEAALAELKACSLDSDQASFTPHSSRRSLQQDPDLVYIVDDDEDSGRYYDVILKSASYRTNVFHDLDAFRTAVAKKLPDLIIMDIVFPEGSMAGIEAINNLQSGNGIDIPIIFTSVRSDLPARSNALRAGGCSYVTKPVDPDTLLAVVSRNTNMQQRKYRVLLVDDDPYTLVFCETLLRNNQYEVESISEPQKIMHAVETFRPDALVIDYHMPGYKGDELLKLLRQDERYVHIPAIMLTADSESGMEQFSMSQSRTRFVQKPVDNTLFLDTLSKLIGSANLTRPGMSDKHYWQPRGMPDLKYYFSVLESIMASADRDEQHYILLYLGIDDPASIRERIGLKQVDQLDAMIARHLAHLVGKNELVSKFRDFVYLVLIRADDQAGIKSSIDRLRYKLASEIFNINNIEISVTASIGAISLTSKLDSVDEAINLAEQAALKASHNGGNQEYIEISNKRQPEETSQGIGHIFLESFRNDGLRLYYQPIVNIDTNESIHEAYARFVTDDSVYTPMQFMPYIEEYDLAFDFNKKIIGAALQDMYSSEAGEQEPEKTVIVKLVPSRKTLSDLVAWFSGYLQAENIRVDNRLIFCFREDWVVGNQRQLEPFITKASEAGCGLALDHVGISKYTIELVEAVQPVLVKLAPVLVRNLATTERAGTINIIRQLQSRDVNIVASAVENAETFTLLMSLGIQQFQGFFVQQPIAELDYTVNTYDM